MPDNPARRLTLAEAMATIAATATGLAASRYFPPWVYDHPMLTADQNKFFYWTISLELWLTVLLPCLLMWTFTSFALHRRQGRWRRMFRRPGIAASTTTILVLAAVSSNAGLSELSHSSGDFLNYSFKVLVTLANVNGLAVGALWMVLLLGGLWCPTLGPGDRLGRLLGWFWIALSAIYGILGPLAWMMKG